MDMISRYKFFLWVTIMLLFAPSTCTLAQTISGNSKPDSYWEFGINGGITQFYGDLWNGKIFTDFNETDKWRYGVGFTLKKQFSAVFGLRTQALKGELSGENKNFDARFNSNFLEFNLSTTINISNLMNQNKPNRTVSLYAILGAGFTNYYSTTYGYNNDVIIAQKDLNNEKIMEFSYVGGLGLNFRLGKHWAIQLETANRLLQSDVIDITDNGRKSDIYNYTSIGLQFRFGKAKKKVRLNNEFSPGEINKQVIEDNQPKIQAEKDAEKTEVNKPVNTTRKQQAVPPPKESDVRKAEIIKKDNSQELVKSDKQHSQTPNPEYRVQIRACLQCRIDKKHLGLRYNLDPYLIKEDSFGNYNIYTIGSFATYQEAKLAKNQIIEINKITDAFIVAFSKGIRLAKLPNF